MRKPYSSRGKSDLHAPKPSPAQKSVEKHIDRAGLISAAGAIISGLFAIPGGIYAASQLSEIRTASQDAAASLKAAQELSATAKSELAELKRQTEAASQTAQHTQALASHTNDIAASTQAEAGGIRDLVGQARAQAIAAANSAQATNEQIQLAKREQIPVIYPTSYQLQQLAAGRPMKWTYSLVSRNGRVPDEISIYTRAEIISRERHSPPIPACGAPGSETLYFKQGQFTSTLNTPITADEVQKVQDGRLMAILYGIACFKADNKWAGAAQICAGSSRGEIFDCRPGGSSQ